MILLMEFSVLASLECEVYDGLYHKSLYHPLN